MSQPATVRAFAGVPLIYFRLHTEGIAAPVIVEVVGDELFRFLIFCYDGTLPGQKIRHQFSLEFLVFSAQTAVDSAPHIREILPGIDAVAPVIQSPGLVECFQIIIRSRT